MVGLCFIWDEISVSGGEGGGGGVRIMQALLLTEQEPLSIELQSEGKTLSLQKHSQLVVAM